MKLTALVSIPFTNQDVWESCTSYVNDIYCIYFLV